MLVQKFLEQTRSPRITKLTAKRRNCLAFFVFEWWKLQEGPRTHRNMHSISLYQHLQTKQSTNTTKQQESIAKHHATQKKQNNKPNPNAAGINPRPTKDISATSTQEKHTSHNSKAKTNSEPTHWFCKIGNPKADSGRFMFQILSKGFDLPTCPEKT